MFKGRVCFLSGRTGGDRVQTTGQRRATITREGTPGGGDATKRTANPRMGARVPPEGDGIPDQRGIHQRTIQQESPGDPE